jgi:hypothetical protein
LERNQAAEEFAKLLVEVGVQQGNDALFESLNRPLGPHKEAWAHAKEWYDSQPDGIQELVRFLTREAMVMALFGVAVHLDGGGGYRFVGDRVAEFTVGMNVYRNAEQASLGVWDEAVEICPTKRGEEVHDIFLSRLGE